MLLVVTIVQYGMPSCVTVACHTLSAAGWIYSKKWRQAMTWHIYHSLPLSWHQYSNNVESRYDLKELQLVILLFSGAYGNSNMNTCNEQSPEPKPQWDCMVTFTSVDGLWENYKQFRINFFQHLKSWKMLNILTGPMLKTSNRLFHTRC